MRNIEYYDNKNVISKALRRIRREKHLTQEQLVAKLQTMNVNIDQRSLSKIENNLRTVTDYEFVCLCLALGVSERELLSDFYAQYADQD